MRYVIDGYNVTKSDPATRELPLEEQRDALVARLRVRGREMLGPGEIVVVFDGEGGAGATTTGGAPVEVRFSRSGSADDAIVDLVRRSGCGGSVCIVTSDNGLADRVSAHGGPQVKVMGREVAFEASGKGRSRKGRKPYPAGQDGVPSGGNSITAELKKLWLPDEEEE